MNNLAAYIACSSLSLALFWLIYRMFLRRETYFRLNRSYLLGAMLFSLLAPLLPFPAPGTFTSSLAVYLNPVTILPDPVAPLSTGHLRWMEMACIVWLTGASLFLLRFLVQVVLLVRMTRKAGSSHTDGIRIVPVDYGYSPFSFFRVIFLRREGLDEERLRVILGHEQVHIRQGHSWDLLAGGILTSLQWFNPCAWLAVRDLKTLHEYLADEGVLRSGADPSAYRQLILDEILGIRISSLASNFNMHLLKKRIAMMTTKRSPVWKKTKFLLILPSLAAALSILTAGAALTYPREGTPDTGTVKDSVYKSPEHMPAFPGGDQELVKFILTNLKYPAEALKQKIEGKVLVNFIVRKDGSIGEVKIIRGIGGGCDEEAARVVKMMPRWTPGTVKGKPVNVSLVLPIQFAAGEKGK
jgi:TonB family protein